MATLAAVDHRHANEAAEMAAEHSTDDDTLYAMTAEADRLALLLLDAPITYVRDLASIALTLDATDFG